MSRAGKTSEVFECNLCTKSQKQVKRLIMGDGVYIYNEYIRLYSEIIEEKFPRVEAFGLQGELPKPKEIRDFLDQYMIRQDTAKKALAVTVYNHYKRIMSEQTCISRLRQGEEPAEVGRPNILLVGPIGYGKIYLARTLAKTLNVPFAMVDVTVFTETGYVGENTENILLKLIQTVNFDIKKAETGIIYIDEIDEVVRKSENPSIIRDISGEEVQQALLKILEGTIVSAPSQSGHKHLHQDFLQIDTTKVLFTVGGALVGLGEVINSYIGKRPLGFSVDTSVRKEVIDPLSEVRLEDLHRFGLIPGFIGRLPMILTVPPLDRKVLSRILVESRNALIKQLVRLFELDGMQLDFTDEATDTIVELVLERGTGTHNLRAALEELLFDMIFEMPSAEDVAQAAVTRKAILRKVQPGLTASSRVAKCRGLLV